MSTFNPEAFMQSSVSEASDTQYLQVPEGEFAAAIDAVTPRTTQTGKALLNVKWKVTDPVAQEATGMAEPTVFQTIWLDVTEQGGLDMGKGKNVGLGKLRDALGQNKPGQPWSPGMLVGGVAKIKVAHSIDKRDNVTINAEVKAVTKL
jgi:hypothetical protein